MKLLLLLFIAGAVLTVEASIETCPLKELNAQELIAVQQAKELACWELHEKIKKNLEKNVRPTADQVEIKDECLNNYTEEYLKTNYGGWFNKLVRKVKNAFNKLTGKIKTVPCYNDDKILKNAVENLD